MGTKLKILRTLCAHGTLAQVIWFLDKYPDLWVDSEMFLAACEQGNLERMQWLFDTYEFELDNTRQLIKAACKGGWIEIVDWLEDIIDLLDHDDLGIRTACKYGHLQLAKDLAARGADVRAEGDKALINACLNGHREVVIWIHSLGADLGMANGHLIAMACCNGHLGLAQWLYAEGVDPYHWYSWRAAELACKHRQFEILRWLASEQFELSVRTENLIIAASQYYQIDILKFLHEEGIDLCSSSRIIRCACQDDEVEILEWLLTLDIPDARIQKMLQIFGHKQQIADILTMHIRCKQTKGAHTLRE